MRWGACRRPCTAGDQGRYNVGSEGRVGVMWAGRCWGVARPPQVMQKPCDWRQLIHVLGHGTRCLSRLWQGWVTHVEDVAFFPRVVGSHWHIESRGVMRSDFRFKASLWLLRGEWSGMGKGEVGDGARGCC